MLVERAGLAGQGAVTCDLSASVLRGEAPSCRARPRPKNVSQARDRRLAPVRPTACSRARRCPARRTPRRASRGAPGAADWEAGLEEVGSAEETVVAGSADGVHHADVAIAMRRSTSWPALGRALPSSVRRCVPHPRTIAANAAAPMRSPAELACDHVCDPDGNQLGERVFVSALAASVALHRFSGSCAQHALITVATRSGVLSVICGRTPFSS